MEFPASCNLFSNASTGHWYPNLAALINTCNDHSACFQTQKIESSCLRNAHKKRDGSVLYTGDLPVGCSTYIQGAFLWDDLDQDQ